MTAILERDEELASLSRTVDAASAGNGSVALIRGEAGIGKSTLVMEFAEQARSRADLFVGVCDDLLTPQPFGPFWDVARAYEPLAGALQEGEGRAVMECLFGLLSRPLRPTVLILEDTQWADEATIDTIKFLGRRIGRTRGVLALTYRDGELDDDHPLRQVIGELPPKGLVRVGLQPLSLAAIDTLVADSDLDAEAVFSLTGGNPLFVAEVVAGGSRGVPTSVQDTVLGRAAKLSTDARRLLHLIAVVPGGADRGLLDASIAAPASALEECVRQGLLEISGDGHIEFCHELQRRAVEASLSPERRRELNHTVLATLGENSDPARLAHHAREANDVDALVRHAPRAARAAIASESYREAVAHFRVLEPHLDLIDATDRADLLEDWARGESDLGDARSVGLVTAAIGLRRELGDVHALARTLTFAVYAYERNAMIDAAEACASEAVALLEQQPAAVALASALTEQARLCFVRGIDDRQAAALADRALGIAEDVADRKAQVRAMIWKGAIAHNVGDPAGFGLVEEAQRLAAQAGYRYEDTIALVNLAGMCADIREVARAADFVQRARDTAARFELRAQEAYAQAMHAEILLWQGHWDLAEDTASGILDSSPHPVAIAWRILGLLQARRGRAEAVTTLERMWEAAERSDELQHLDPAASVLAEHAWLSGDLDRWRERITRTAQRSGASGQPWPSGAFVFWLRQLGLVDQVPEHTPTYFRAILDGDIDRAVAFWRSRGVPYEEGLALAFGDVPSQLQAIEIFEGLGATPAANRVRERLREAGVQVPRGRSRSTRAHAVGLTARQAEVLGLLAAGMSNAEIADELFISHRTVENHVAGILMKLDVPDRQAAARRAMALGLLDGS